MGMLNKSAAATADPLAAVPALVPARYLSADIETANCDAKLLDEIVAREMDGWEPPANYKDPTKIAERKKEAEQKIREKSALLDCSPIACVALRTETESVVFNGVDGKKYSVNHSVVLSCGEERAMLLKMRDWLDSRTNAGTIVIGFNILGFDLPRLRVAYARNKLRLPAILTPRILEDERQPVVDVMKMYLNWFTADAHGRPMISLGDVIERLGLPAYKNRIDGSMIPTLIAEGRVAEVLEYCALDTSATLTAWLRMTSMEPQLT